MRDALLRAERVTRTPLLLEAGATARVGSFVRSALGDKAGAAGVEPGARCIVLATRSAAKRAAPVLHFLRKGGYYPLLCELEDGSPIAAHTVTAVAAAKRTGSTFVVAFGGSAIISVGRAVAALLSNGGKVMDFAGSLGGARTLEQPSVPFLTVPSCPSGLELSREALLLCEGRNLAVLRAHAASPQAALVDPLLAGTLEGEPALCTGFAALLHALEAYLRMDSDAPMRRLSWIALEAAARALRPSVAAPNDPTARTLLATASALTSAAMACGPLGPSRAAALSVASRFAISYSAALSAVGPAVVGAMADRIAEAAEEEEDMLAQAVAEADAEGGEGMQWRGNLGDDEAADAAAATASRKRAALWNSKATVSAFSSKARLPGGGAGGKTGGGKEGAKGPSPLQGGKGPGGLGELSALKAGMTKEQREELKEYEHLTEQLKEFASEHSSAAEMLARAQVEESDTRTLARRYAHAAVLLSTVAGLQGSSASATAAAAALAAGAPPPWAPYELVTATVAPDAPPVRAAVHGLEATLHSLRRAGECQL